MIDHMGFEVSDLARSLEFYEAALAPIGIAVVMRITKEESGGYEAAGLGRDGKPSLWISGGGKTEPRLHIAIAADARTQVDAVYAAAVAAGGTDNGKPGIREHYHPSYYAAFVLDPDGHNIEAVCHEPE